MTSTTSFCTRSVRRAGRRRLCNTSWRLRTLHTPRRRQLSRRASIWRAARPATAKFHAHRKKPGKGWADFAEDFQSLVDKTYPALQYEARE